MNISGTINRNLCVIHKALILFFALLIIICPLSAQSKIDSLFGKLDPQKWAAAVLKKSSKLEDLIISKSEKTLRKLQSQEEKIYKKMLTSKDSLEAKLSLERIKEQYAGLNDKLRTNPSSFLASSIKEYIPRLDSVQSALNFLYHSGLKGYIPSAFSKIQSLNARFQQAGDISQFIKDRKQELKRQLENLGLAKQLKQFNKQIYYFGEQINEYKAVLNDPKKIEKKVIELLWKTSAMQDFFQRNNMLSLLFPMPLGNSNSQLSQNGFLGLQTRGQLDNYLQQARFICNSGGSTLIQQNISNTLNHLNQIKSRISQDKDAPIDDSDLSGFKPNGLKSKSFIKRIEFNINFQSKKADMLFPTTTDIGLSAGYKLNEFNVVGIGASYKIGWGKSWNSFRFSNQALGVRSFLECKVKQTIQITGGYELNYWRSFKKIQQLKDLKNWQASGIIGVNKIIPVRSKVVKKIKAQLLWDFLSYQQIPRTQPIIFRLGYVF